MDGHCRSTAVRLGLPIVLLAVTVMDAWAIDILRELDGTGRNQQLQWSGPNPIPPWEVRHQSGSSLPATTTTETTSLIAKTKVMPDLFAAIVAGLIGSIVTAFLSYYVQQRLARTRRREEEERLAFAFLVPVSEFVAAEEVFTKVLQASAPIQKLLEPELKKLSSPDIKVELTHGICVLVSEAIRRLIEEDASTGKMGYKNITATLKELSLGLDRYSIPLDLVAQLPREAVVAYNNMLQSIEALKSYIRVWESWGEPEGKELVSAKTLYSQWTGIQKLGVNARILRKALIVKGGISEDEANRILREQVGRGLNSLVTSLGPDKLMAAEDAFRKHLRSESESVQSDKETGPSA